MKPLKPIVMLYKEMSVVEERRLRWSGRSKVRCLGAPCGTLDARLAGSELCGVFVVRGQCIALLSVRGRDVYSKGMVFKCSTRIRSVAGCKDRAWKSSKYVGKVIER
jgi:hypothetical protein